MSSITISTGWMRQHREKKGATLSCRENNKNWHCWFSREGGGRNKGQGKQDNSLTALSQNLSPLSQRDFYRLFPDTASSPATSLPLIQISYVDTQPHAAVPQQDTRSSVFQILPPQAAALISSYSPPKWKLLLVLESNFTIRKKSSAALRSNTEQGSHPKSAPQPWTQVPPQMKM